MQLTRSEIVEELKKILITSDEKNRVQVERCTEDWELTTDFGFTSIGILYIVIAVEETFGIRFENVSMSDFRTLGNVVDYIEEKLQ